MKKTFLALLVLNLIFGCSSYTNPEPETNDAVTFRPNQGQGMGLIVVDFGNEEPKFERGGLFYKPSTSTERNLTGYKKSRLLEITYKTRALTNSELGIENKDRYVYLITFKIPEGNYNFYDFLFGNNYVYYQEYVRSKKEFNLPFTITNNQINYLGQLNINQTKSGISFKINDNFEDNLKMYKQKYKFLYLENAENKTIDRDENNTGMFIFN